MSMTAANKLDRIIGVLFWLQLVIGIVLAISWPVALKAPGPLAGAALTLLFRTLMRRGTLTSRSAVTATSLVLALGIVYPWPWVSDVDETTEKAAQVRRLAGPEGCVCLAIVVDTIWEPKEKYGGQATAFCVPESDERLTRWLEEGTVSSEWRLTFRTKWFTETTLYSLDLLSVEEVPSEELYANNGCENVMP